MRDAILADPDRLWPSGIVEFKFYRTFPRCFGNVKDNVSMLYLLQKAQAEDEEGDEIHKQPDLLHHLPARHQLQLELCYNRPRSIFLLFVCQMLARQFFRENIKILAKMEDFRILTLRSLASQH